MEALIIFVIWASLIFLIMRFGCGAQVAGHGHETAVGEAGNAEGRREIFEAAPDLFLGGKIPSHSELEHSHA